MLPAHRRAFDGGRFCPKQLEQIVAAPHVTQGTARQDAPVLRRGERNIALRLARSRDDRHKCRACLDLIARRCMVKHHAAFRRTEHLHMRQRGHQTLVFTVEPDIFVTDDTAMDEKPVQSLRIALAHICIDIAQSTEFHRGHGAALHIALVGGQLQDRIRTGFLESRVRRRIPCQDRCGVERDGQILHVLGKVLGDINVALAFVVAMKIEHDVVRQGELDQRGLEALRQRNRRIGPGKLRRVEIRQERESTVEIGQGKRLETAKMLMRLPLVRADGIGLRDNRDIAKDAPLFGSLLQHGNQEMKRRLPRKLGPVKRGLKIGAGCILVLAVKAQHAQLDGIARHIAGEFYDLGLHFISHSIPHEESRVTNPAPFHF